MRHILFPLILFGCLTSFGQDSTQKNIKFDYEEYIKISSERYSGKQFGEFSIKTSDSTKFSNADLHNKIVFINFWFESCPPCISELEGFNKLFDTLKKNKNFVFVSFTFDPDLTIQKMINKYNIKYNVFHIDRTECYRLNFNNGFPASFILDRIGIIKYSKFGGFTDKEKATKAIMSEIYPKIIEQL